MIVAGVDISRKYHYTEIFDMYEKGLLKPIALKGYVVRCDSDGMIGFVPWDQSLLGRQETGQRYVFDAEGAQLEMAEQLEEEHPIVPTTPQEKVTRMALRILAEYKRGGALALPEQEVRKIAGEAWANGQTDITMESIRALAAHYLGVAEVDNKEADSHRVTRAHKA